jgi:DNA polymerase IIIc chi subunit
LANVAFYELPRGQYWEGLARLVVQLAPKGRSVVLVESSDEASRMSKHLWDLPQVEMVPHGTLGVDGDEDLDPVLIAVKSYDGPRRIRIFAWSCPIEAVSPGDFVIEPVPNDPAGKQRSRDRYRRYRECGYHPTFISWKEWAGDSSATY